MKLERPEYASTKQADHGHADLGSVEGRQHRHRAQKGMWLEDDSIALTVVACGTALYMGEEPSHWVSTMDKQRRHETSNGKR